MQTGTSSFWQQYVDTPALPILGHDLRVDVAVVGGGITGLTLAALLAEQGRSVAVLERNRIGSGTTGRSTAHLTASLDVEFGTLIQHFGEPGARTVVGSVVQAIDEIERRVVGAGRECGFRRVPGYRFAETAEQAKSLEQEASRARSLGLDVAVVETVPLPFRCAAALRFERQAEIDPLAYLCLLSELVGAAGGRIFEHSPVVEIADDRVTLAHGPRVQADQIVDATHTPVGLVASIQTRVTAYTSYVLAARLEEPLAAGLFWDLDDPYHYIRSAGTDGSVLVGGEDHRTGRESDPAARLAALEAWTRQRLPVRSIGARWSHELFEPADGVPYIGALPGARSRFVAAGFSGTGLTFGTVAALLLRDVLIQGNHPWEGVYAPSRLKPLASARPVAEENLRIGWRFVADRVSPVTGARRGDLPPDSGCVERIGGRQRAVYRDVHATGKPLYGPPTAPLVHEPIEGEGSPLAQDED
jgi:glycine/D-amino acid oxidase-like deaminating enzyme